MRSTSFRVQEKYLLTAENAFPQVTRPEPCLLRKPSNQDNAAFLFLRWELMKWKI
jgi:hypothetical protein